MFLAENVQMPIFYATSLYQWDQSPVLPDAVGLISNFSDAVGEIAKDFPDSVGEITDLCDVVA